MEEGSGRPGAANDERAHTLAILREHFHDLRTRYGLATLAVYGSYARGTPTAGSDLDLLAEFRETPTLFDLARLQAELEALLGRKVDLTTPEGLNPRLLSIVRGDAVRV